MKEHAEPITCVAKPARVGFYARFLDWIGRQIFQMGVLVGFLALCVFFTLTSPYFLSFDNMMNVARQISMIGIIAVGMTFVIIAAGIDLSVGSVVGLAGCITAGLLRDGIPMPVAILTGLSFGLISGIANGFLVTKGGLPPFIATLASMSVWRGLALTYTQGYAIFGLPKGFGFIGRSYMGPVPTPVVIMFVVFAIGYYVLNHTAFGRYVYAVGGNIQAAKLSGVHVDRTLLAVYGLSGFFSGLSGIILASRLMSGQGAAGTGYELDAIASCALGGISLMGGEGNLVGTIIGAFIIGVLANGMTLLNVSSFYQMMVKGLVIMLAVFVDLKLKARREKK
ncbi:MAG: ribose ABC transporter permease [Chloroflexi bacterium]|nr:ribose ABC transporter permease [Chloroflexota bacterium]